MTNVSQIPLNKVPFLDERTQPMLVSREWYRFLNNLFTLTGSGGNALTLADVQVGPPEIYPDLLTALQVQVDDLNASPTSTPQVDPARYGDAYDTSTQTAAVINTAYAATFNSSGISRGVTIGSPTSRIYVDRPGVYSIEAQLRYEKTGGAGGTVVTWMRRNGVDISASGQMTYVTTTNLVASQPLPYVIQLAAGDYIEVMWAVSDITIQLRSAAASAPYPIIPSARVTVTKITG